MTTMADMRDRVFTKARDSSRTFVTETDVTIWLTEAIEDLSARLQLGQKEKTGTTSGSTIAIPDDYVALISLKVVTDGDDYVIFVNDDVFRARQEDSDSLDYTLGRVFNGNFELYPTPDSGSAYTIRYWNTSSGVSDLSPPLKTKAVNYAIARVKEKEDDFRAAEYYMGLYEHNLPNPNNLSPNAPILQDITFQAGPFDTAEAEHN